MTNRLKLSQLDRQAAGLTNTKEAIKIVTAHAEAEFDAVHAQERGALALEEQELEARYIEQSSALRNAEKALSDTPSHKPCLDAYTPESTAADQQRTSSPRKLVRRKIAWADWEFWDQMTLTLFVVGSVVAMILGAGNVYANLMSSGQPVFIEDPWLAVLLSMGLPIGSLAIKGVTNRLPYERQRTRYCFGVNLATLVIAITWAVLFSDQFQGVAADIDIEAMLASGGDSRSLVLAQLLLEMLAGSALFLNAESIYTKYSPFVIANNPNHPLRRDVVTQLTKETTSLRHELGITRGRREQIDAQRAQYIAERVAAMLAFRTQLKALETT